MTSRTRSLLLALTTVLAFGFATLANAAPKYVPGEILVKYKTGLKTTQKSVLRDEIGGQVLHEMNFIGVEHLQVRGMAVEEAVARLSLDPRVEYVEPNYLWSLDVVPNDTRYPEMYQLHNTGQTGGTPGADIRAEQAWATFTGDPNILVGVIDTGVDYTHPDLAANAWTNPGEIPGNNVDDDGNGYVDDVHGYDFVNNDGDPFDDNEHGTHCSGTIAAVGNNALGTTGINWRAKIAGIKFLSASGSGSTANAVLGIQYAITIGCRLTSNSWGGGGFSQALLDAINAAGAAGQLFVASQGNASTNTDVSPSYPAAYDSPYIIGVAATDHNDQLASFSNYGATTCDLGAPGVDVLSLMPGGGYQLLSGTSMAGPHVSGACAFMFGRFPGMTNMQVKQRIMQFADPIPALTGRCVTGARLNLFMAAADPDSIPPGAVSDLATENPGSNSMGLVWTATGDDGGVGTASEYELRYSTSPITEANFGAATLAPAPNPQAAGSTEHAVVNGLSFSTPYYFALKAKDEFGNAGPLSNVATGTTLGPPDISVAPSAVAKTLNTGAQGTEAITITNNSAGTLDWTIPTPSLNFGTAAINKPIILAKGVEPTPGEPQLLGAGGPDGFGYRWQDSDEPGGPTFAWVDIAQPGNAIALTGDDANGGPVNIGFNFPFYGGTFNSVRVCTNGWLSFTDTGTGYSNQTLPNSGAPANLVAPFWDDLNFGTSNLAYAYNDGSKFVVSWVGVPRYSDAASVMTFQAILYPSGEIRYQYLTMTGLTNSATIGMQNAAKTIGLQTAANQAYVHNNLAVRIIPLRQWLTSSPTSGHIAPFSSQLVNVGFDATGLGSGVYTGTVHVLSNDPDTPDVSVAATLTVIGAPDIVVSATSLDFGSLFVGGTSTRTFSVSNGGTDPLDVTSISSSDPQFTASPAAFTLAPGGSQTVTCNFTPGSAATFNANLSIASNDPDENPTVVAMTGTGTNAPVLVVNPGSLAAATANGIGPQAVTKVKKLVVTNNGGSPLTFTAGAYQGIVPASAGMSPPQNVEGAKGDDGQPGALGSGGPDAGGYRWIDSDAPGGPTPGFVDISGSGTLLSFSSRDDGTTTVALPFSVNWYGAAQTQLSVCTNGWAAFGTTTLTTYTNTDLPNTGTTVPPNMLAVFWDDMDLRVSGNVYTKNDGGRFIVMWKDVQHYLGTAGNPTYSYEIIIYPNGNVEYQYAGMNADLVQSTIGIQNGNGTVGLRTTFNAAYMHSNMAIRYSRKPDWLRLDHTAGTVAPGGTDTLRVTFSAVEYADGDYDGEVRLTSNDPAHATLAVPAHMHVGVASATLAMNPRWLSSVSGGPTVTLDVLAPGAPEAIDPASLLVNGGAGSAPGEAPSFPGNGHGLFKFRVLDLLPVVDEGKNVPLSAIGEVADVTWFTGATTINVVKPEMLAGPLAAYRSGAPTFRGAPGRSISMSWKEPQDETVTGYDVMLSLDGGATWSRYASTPHTDIALVLPEANTEQAMVEIVAMDAGRAVGSWLSDPFVISSGVTGVNPDATPKVFGLRFAGQNPVRTGSARLVLAMPQRGDVNVTVYDVRGAVVRTLANGNYGAGNHSFEWDGRDTGGQSVGSGIFFVKASNAGHQAVVRVAYIH